MVKLILSYDQHYGVQVGEVQEIKPIMDMGKPIADSKHYILDNVQNLQNTNWSDLPQWNKESDGISAYSGMNRAWEITQEDYDELLILDSRIADENVATEKAKIIESLKRKIERAEKSGRIYATQAEANDAKKAYNNLHNEDGDGFLPRFYTQSMVNGWKKRLADPSLIVTGQGKRIEPGHNCQECSKSARCVDAYHIKS